MFKVMMVKHPIILPVDSIWKIPVMHSEGMKNFPSRNQEQSFKKIYYAVERLCGIPYQMQ